MNTGFALVAAAPGDGWGHMGNGGWMWTWGAAMAVLWVAVIGAAAWLIVRAMASRRVDSSTPRATGMDRARTILGERYARGEIGTDEYSERLARLR